MQTNHHTRLTAPELANLWTQYMNDSMACCLFRYALEHIEDDDIRSIYEYALELSTHHVQKIKTFFKQENYPIPMGFTKEDVNTKAPRLFQDPFYLNYIYIMSLHGLTGYALSVSTSSRTDMRAFYIECNKETMMLYEKCIAAMQHKGIYNRPPIINPPEVAQFVQDQNFLTGWLGNRRPMTALEISDITFNMNKMHLHVALKVGFAQVAQSKRVRKAIMRGIDITLKHTEIFQSLFNEEHLNSPVSWQSHVTNSTTSPFSDKLMMHLIQFSTQTAIAFYGTALSVNTRRDLGTHYLRLIVELLKYGEDCTNMLIDKGWMEEPPMATDRRALANRKN